MKNRRSKKLIRYMTAVAACAALLAGCAPGSGFSALLQDDAGAKGDDAAPAAVNIANYPGIYDSEDVAVVVRKDAQAKTIQLQNITTSRRYTLTYDGITTVYDKNEQALSMDQVKEGSVVTVRFYKPGKTLAYIKENPDCISLANVRSYTMDLKNGTITVGGGQYNISSHVVVVSDGRETDMMEVNQMDELSLWGYKNMIYGIHVEKGHGYLRLQNEDYFVGGWIDVGDKVIRKVSEDMLLVVPEGTHRVTVSHKGSSATQEIAFARNEEMAWDLGNVEITVVQKGKIIFTLTPVTAKVEIDGKQVDVSKPVELEYGIHQMRVTADGHDPVSQYIKVAEPSANIAVELEANEEAVPEETEEETSGMALEDDDEDDEYDDEDDEDEGDGTPAKKSQASYQEEDEEEESEEERSSEKDKGDSSPVISASGKYKVYIDAPDGVEAYLDGNYIGITPLSFPKKAGSYVVTLRKDGHQTRSYTLQIDNEEKDINYSFTELMKLEE